MITVRAFTSDVAVPGYLRLARIRDEILTPISSGKTLATAETWQGALRPKLDYFVEQTEKATRGFALGHVVGAEEAPGGLVMGQLWTGLIDLRDVLTRATAVAAERPAVGHWHVDLDEIFTELENFRASVGSQPDMNTMKDAVAGLKRARDAVDAQVRSRDTADAVWGTSYLAQDKVRNRSFALNWNANCRAKYDGERSAATRDSYGRLLPQPGTRQALERQIQGGAASNGVMRNWRCGDFSRPINNAEWNRNCREFYAKKKA